jgi:hypothetical protein
MNSLKLLNSAFKRICNFVEKGGFKIRNVKGGVAFYYYPDTKLFNYTWIWKNKKEMLLGRKINDYILTYSLFSRLNARYEYIKRCNINNTEPVSEPISETTLDFINACRCLKDCSCLEELVIKMDLMGI